MILTSTRNVLRSQIRICKSSISARMSSMESGTIGCLRRILLHSLFFNGPLGINTNLRASDLLQIKIDQVKNLSPEGELLLKEKKQANQEESILTRLAPKPFKPYSKRKNTMRMISFSKANGKDKS